MLSFKPTDEQTMLIDAIRKFAVNELQPAAHDADEDGALQQFLLQKGWEIGIIPASIPEAYGGFGEHSAVTNALAVEELAYGDLAHAIGIMAPGLFGFPIHISGTEEQKKQYLPLLAEAEPPAFTAALIEPGLKADLNAPRSVARRDGDQIVLNGAKTYVPLAKDAKLMVVYARDAESGKVDGYIVERNTPGLTICDREKLMGVRALPLYSITLENLKLSSSAKIGGEAGTRYQRLLSHSWVALAAMAVGVARAASEYSREYAKQRVQFGAPIATKQSIAFMLAEVAIEVDAARLMAWKAAWQLDKDPESDGTDAAYLAKEYADKAVMLAADCGVQVLGGYGYIREYPVERWLRNARGFSSFTGLALI